MSFQTLEKAVTTATESTLHKNPLLRPFRLRNTVFKNRVLSTSHSPNYVEDAMPQLRYQLYHEEKAKGGIALSMFGGSSNVSIDSPSVFGQIDLSQDRVVPHLNALSDRLHGYDCKLMCQITHMGRRTTYDVGSWTCPVAPSPVREHAHRAFPKELDKFEIERIIEDYAEAAYRCYKGGLDGIELCAFMHLIDQFWSVRSNKRKDEYGGCFENRVRFALNVIDACRNRIDNLTTHGDGNDFLIGIRMGISEVDYDSVNRDADAEVDDDMDSLNGHYTISEGIKIGTRLASTGQLDFINANVGEGASLSGLSRNLPNMSHKLTPHLQQVEQFRRAMQSLEGLTHPVALFHAGRAMDVWSARHCIESDALDMVGMTRAHMADPHIVSKLQTGQEEDIRPCVGAAYCIDRIYKGHEALCIHNAATGREYQGLPQTIEMKAASDPVLKVLVLGGGIAGLECARILAIRGHDVELHEAGRRYGGQVCLASEATWRRDLIGVVDWRVSQCKKLGVKMFTESLMDLDRLQSEGYVRMDGMDSDEVESEENEENEGNWSGVDLIVDATGGVPNMEIIEEGRGRQHCQSTWDVLSGMESIGDDVIIFDVRGDHQGPSCAEFIKLKRPDAKVEIITPDRCIGEELGNTNYPVHLRNLYNLGVKMTCDWHVHRVDKNAENGRLKVELVCEYDSSVREVRECDQVLVEYGTLPADSEMFDELRKDAINNGEVDLRALVENRPCVKTVRKNEDGKYWLIRVGDSLVSRNIHAAVLDALRMCKDI